MAFFLLFCSASGASVVAIDNKIEQAMVSWDNMHAFNILDDLDVLYISEKRQIHIVKPEALYMQCVVCSE